MKARHISWLFVLILASEFVLAFVEEPTNIGISMESSNGSYHFAGGTGPWALALAGLLAGCYLLLMYAVTKVAEPFTNDLRRRFWASCIDFIIAMTITSPLIGIIPVLAEWRRTGNFQWSFERTYYVPSDGLLTFFVFIPFGVGLIAYFALPLLRRKPSPGSCILGYQVLFEDQSTLTVRKAVHRTLLGFVAVWRGASLFRKQKPGKFWLDEKFGTNAFRLK